MIAGWPFLGYDLDVSADMGSIVHSLTAVQQPVRIDLASRLKVAWAATKWDETTTGLLAALQSDLWTFPALTDDEDLKRQAFRQLGDAIAIPALANENTLQTFLFEESVVRDGGQPPSVHDRLLALDTDGAEDLERNWNTEAEALWNRRNPDAGGDPFRPADLRRLSYCELVFDMLNESLMSLAGYDPAAGESAYGGYDLQRGDNDPAAADTTWTYGGETVTLEAGAERPKYIDELRRDLEQIGFGPLADGDMAPDPTHQEPVAADAARERQPLFIAWDYTRQLPGDRDAPSRRSGRDRALGERRLVGAAPSRRWAGRRGRRPRSGPTIFSAPIPTPASARSRGRSGRPSASSVQSPR